QFRGRSPWGQPDDRPGRDYGCGGTGSTRHDRSRRSVRAPMEVLTGPPSGAPARRRPFTMRRFDDLDDLVLSASDLTSFLACARLTQEQLKAALGVRGRLPRDDGLHAELVRAHGDSYEQVQL